MTRTHRSVESREKALQPDSPKPQISLLGAREIYTYLGGRVIHCTIDGYFRTQVFEFPRTRFHPDDDELTEKIYVSPTVQACVTSNLEGHFVHSNFSNHYAIDPSLKHMVSTTDEKARSQLKDQVPVFLVTEEACKLPPVDLHRGECRILDEVVHRNGKTEPLLVGGREGQRFISAHFTTDGAWPDLPNNQHLVNMILAGVRVAQQSAEPISKLLDLDCLVTIDGQFVNMVRPELTASANTGVPMDNKALRKKVTEIRKAVSAMEGDIGVAHMALLYNSMYRDKLGDDAYQRLHFLQLWQSLDEAGKKWLRYHGNDVRNSNTIVAGKKTLRELTDYRNDIAHWWTDTIDKNLLADLQRTINELIRYNYF